jgi:ribose transport system permease protein
MTSRRDLVADYFRRQYETKEGSVADNVSELFAEDLVFHLSGDKTMGRHDLVLLCDLLRRTRHDQATMVSAFREEGDTVEFVLYVVGPDPVTGHEVSVSTETRYRFDSGKVVEVWQENSAGIEAAVRAAQDADVSARSEAGQAGTAGAGTQPSGTGDADAAAVHAASSVALDEPPAVAEPVAQADVEQAEFNLLQWSAERGIFVFTALLVLLAAVFVDGFASLANITDVFNRAAPIGIVAVGMTFVVISANYLDLSVVAQVATAAVTLIAVSNESSIPMAMLLALLVAIAYGLVNGTAVGVFKANAVIVTLSTTFIGLGLLRWLTGGSIYFGPPDGPIRSFGTTKLGPFPLSMLVLILSALVLQYVLTRTTFGFMVKSYGSNRDATRLAGVNTAWVVIGAFLISALGAMVGGFVLAAFSNTAVSAMSTGFDFEALAAIIVGGTSVFGGRGSVLRTLLGVVFVSVLTNIMVLTGLGFGYQQMAIGALIVFAVSVDSLARKAAA